MIEPVCAVIYDVNIITVEAHVAFFYGLNILDGAFLIKSVQKPPAFEYAVINPYDGGSSIERPQQKQGCGKQNCKSQIACPFFFRTAKNLSAKTYTGKRYE